MADTPRPTPPLKRHRFRVRLRLRGRGAPLPFDDETTMPDTRPTLSEIAGMLKSLVQRSAGHEPSHDKSTSLHMLRLTCNEWERIVAAAEHIEALAAALSKWAAAQDAYEARCSFDNSKRRDEVARRLRSLLTTEGTTDG